jgi:hypothetical protein
MGNIYLKFLEKLLITFISILRFNILFLLTADGKFNYHGIKKWIEEQSETNDSKNFFL